MARSPSVRQPRSRAVSEDSDEESESDNRQALGFLVGAEDPRTISQIKRSRIDLAKRYVFLCPTSLSKHFEAMPHQAKDTGLLVFRCQRNALFPDPACVRRARTEARVNSWLQTSDKRSSSSGGSSPSNTRGALGSSHYKGKFSREFLKWVLLKEKDGCVFWLKPEKDLQKLSEFIEEKTDLVHDVPYKPLLLDPQWWRVRFHRNSARFVTNPSLVVANIAADNWERGRDFDIPALQELIYQSNPNLEPVSKWPHAPSMRFLPRPGAMPELGSDPRYKGYIDQERALDGSQMPITTREYTRIGRWPGYTTDRLDNLHHLWQSEEASFSRRQTFATCGLSTLGGPPLTAR